MYCWELSPKLSPTLLTIVKNGFYTRIGSPSFFSRFYDHSPKHNPRLHTALPFTGVLLATSFFRLCKTFSKSFSLFYHPSYYRPSIRLSDSASNHPSVHLSIQHSATKQFSFYLLTCSFIFLLFYYPSNHLSFGPSVRPRVYHLSSSQSIPLSI